MQEPFTDGKMSALRSFTQYQFTAAQVGLDMCALCVCVCLHHCVAIYIPGILCCSYRIFHCKIIIKLLSINVSKMIVDISCTFSGNRFYGVYNNSKHDHKQ